MIGYWVIKSESNSESRYLILRKDAIWISEINENETNIEDAYNNKELFGKTKFYHFKNLEFIVFNYKEKKLILNFLANEDGDRNPPIFLDVIGVNFNELISAFSKVKSIENVRELNFFEKNKYWIIILFINVLLCLFIFFTSDFSITKLFLILGLGISEVFIVYALAKSSYDGKILRLNEDY